ncbi:MAG: protoglobin domain-containing protein, partial [Beijerinckiaceae bacterium]
ESLPPSKLDAVALDELKASLLFGPGDVAALRQAGAVIADQIAAILDVWYGFVGGNPHLLKYFSHPDTGAADVGYLSAVRLRFGQWIKDTCAANYDESWLAWQDEIGRRHHRVGKNRTDGVVAAPHIPMRHLLALVMPISATMRTFLAGKGHSAAEVDAMHAAWTKSVLLQAILWSQPYVREGDF